MKTAEFVNSFDPNKAAHNESFYLDLHYSTSKSLNSQNDIAWTKYFFLNLLTNILSSAFWCLKVMTCGS